MTTAPFGIGLVGVGKIARDQHIPAIRSNPAFALIAGASPADRVEGLAGYDSLNTMVAAHPEIRAVAICTPPQIRFTLALEAISRGLDVLLEKPPAATLAEAQALADMARQKGVSLMATWHSRHAAAVGMARDYLRVHLPRRVRIFWKEDVRVWHPGQAWIFQPGGMGVFDPGINALSILTHLIEAPIVPRQAELEIPVNCQAPIRVKATLVTPEPQGRGVDIDLELDFLHEGVQAWRMEIDTYDGHELVLADGGATLSLDSAVQPIDTQPGVLGGEYDAIYARFAGLIAVKGVEADLTPLRLVSDILLVASRRDAPAFYDPMLPKTR